MEENFQVSEAFLDFAYKVLVMSQLQTENERRSFEITCEVCAKFNLPVKKFHEAINELNKRLEELNNENHS